MILRYISGTRDYGILYSKWDDDCILLGYTESDFAVSIDDRKSTSGHIFVRLGAISWASQKQPIVTLSTTEAEYVAATSAACQAVWIRRIMIDLMQDQEGATKIYCDNNSIIELSKNQVFHKRSKHIDTRYHFIRELINNGEIYIEFSKSENQFADIFTKPLAKEIFKHLRKVWTSSRSQD